MGLITSFMSHELKNLGIVLLQECKNVSLIFKEASFCTLDQINFGTKMQVQKMLLSSYLKENMMASK
jgi:hypothetical protein